MYKHARRDDNHREIVDAFRKCGASVQDLADVGNGCPDLLVGILGVSIPVEVKDGKKPPSCQRLTEDEELWHGTWKGTVVTVYSALDAVKLIYKIRNGELN